MDRRDFCGLAGSGAIALPMVGTADDAAAQQRPTYAFTIEIVECRPGGCARGHKPGDVFAYPAEKGRICEWLMDSMSTSIRVLQQGGTLPWLYKGTPYEKVIDPEGVTTEFIRCPDPTSGLVAKITRIRTA
ncbi:MAG: TIGR04076 family protein [Longimicrobiales bacterium]